MDNLKAFAREVIQLTWEGYAEGVQEIAEKHGLITPVPYDPAVHGDNDYAEPGDSIFVFTDLLKK